MKTALWPRRWLWIVNLCLLATASSGPARAEGPFPMPGMEGVKAVQADAFSYEVGPVPGFVQRRPDGAENPAKTARGAKNVRYLLFDRQVSLLHQQPEDYLRVVMQPMDAQGVREASQLYVMFSPDYEKLKVHAVRVIREGRVLDRTAEVKFDLLRRERNLEQQIYEGAVTAVGVLSDIRANDIIEFERTVVGANPIFGGRYSAITALSLNEPVDELRYTLLHPESRQITVRVPAFVTATKSVQGGVARREWVARNLRAVLEEKDRPSWHDPRSWIDASEFTDWQDVARWARDLFDVPGQLEPGLRQQIAVWKAKGLGQAELTAEVLRWVQTEIRYFGIEIGANSHKPYHPNQTYTRRFGDCKDKSLLLATLLNDLGIAAHPALVSLEQNRSVENRLPMPFAFDHAIVRVRLSGRTYWLDPTLPPQHGSLDDISAHDFGRALVVGAAETGLSEAGFPPGYTNRIELTDRYVVKRFAEPAELEETYVAYRADAERLRLIHASLPKAEFSRFIQSDKLRIHPNAKVMGEVQVVDNHQNNSLTLVNRYQVPDLFDYEPGRFKVNVPDITIMGLLKQPEVPDRASPMKLPYPMQAGHEVVFELPENPIRNVPPPQIQRTRFWEHRSQFRTEAKSLRSERRVTSLRDSVPPAEMRSYLSDVQDLRQSLGVSLTLKVAEIPKSEWETLERALSRFERYEKSKSGVVQAQIEAEVMIRQIGYDIASGKLNDPHLAHAHGERALHWDSQDKVEDAVRDIDEAIRLAPAHTGHKLAKARILTGYGRFQEALEIFLALEKEGLGHEFKESDLRGMGEAYFYLGRYEEAARRLDQAAGLSDRTGMLISAFWRHLVSLKSGGAVASTLERSLGAESNRDWPYAVGEMLLGRMTPDQLKDAARSDDPGIERDQLCEAYFYTAQKYLLTGDPDQAGDYFEKAVDLNVVPYLEHKFARLELQRLGDRPGGLMKWLRNL